MFEDFLKFAALAELAVEDGEDDVAWMIEAERSVGETSLGKTSWPACFKPSMTAWPLTD